MGKAHEIFEQDDKYFAHAGRIPYYPLIIDHAHGAVLTDINGKEYIDLLSSASSQNVGHTPEKVVKAIQEQTNKMIHYTPAYMYHEPLANLAQKICELSPGNYKKRVIFGLTGSDACDGIIKFARAYTGRPHIISFTNAYHGSTFGSISLSAISLNMRRKIGPLLPDVHHIPYPDSYRGMYGSVKPNTVEEYLAPLNEMFEKYLPPEEVACIVIETLQGDGGLLEPIEGYFEALEKLCKQHGILIAVDDIQQGMGRTGKWSSIEHFNFEPDLVAYGKSLAGGMPMSAIVGREEILESLASPAHLFTMGANPVSCAAALATLEMLEEDSLVEKSATKGKYAKDYMKKWEEKYEFVGNVRGLGLSIGIDIVKDKKTKERDNQAALKICNRCYERGLVIIAVSGNVLRFQPPLVITDEQLDYALRVLTETMQELEDGKLKDYHVEGQGW